MTVDALELSGRLRRSPAPSYKRRPIERPRPRLLSDVTMLSPGAKQAISLPKQLPKMSQAEQKKPLPPTAIPINRARQDLPVQDSPLLTQTLVHPVAKTKKRRKHNKLKLAKIVIIAVLLGSGVILTFNGWRANKAVQAQAAQLTKQANNHSSQTLSTIKPNLASYVVAPNMPRYIIIPKLGVKARVLSVGVNSQGALGTPNNVFDTAWYNESSLPGQPGAMLIDGHVSSWTTNGVFYGLKTLKPGDSVQVQRGDGKIYSYRVVKSQVYSANNVNMATAMTPIVAGKPGLNLITFTGDVIPGTSEFNERIVVFTTQV